MFRRSNSVTFDCPIHKRPVQYVCVANHVCNPEKNRALCDHCLRNQTSVLSPHIFENINEFLAGEFIYSDIQKTIENLEAKLSENYFENIQKIIEENFDNLQAYCIKTIQDNKNSIIEGLKNKRFERHYILSSWKRLQESLEKKLETLSEQESFQQNDLNEYVGLFNEFKSKSHNEQSFAKLEEEFEKKLLIEDETLQDLRSSLMGTLENYTKSIWHETPNLVNPQSIDYTRLELENTLQVNKKGFRLFGLKYIKELDALLMYDRDSKLSVYDFLSGQIKDLGTTPLSFSIEYIPKKNKVLLGGRGYISVKDLAISMMGEEQREIKIPRTDGMVTSIKYIADQGVVLCSGKFQNIYCLSVEENFKIIDSIQTNPKNDPLFDCTCLYDIKARNLLIGGLELGHLNVYLLKEKTIKEILKGHTDRILSIDYNYIRDTLISGSKDGTIRIWMYRNNEFLINQMINCTSLAQEGKGGVSSLHFLNNNIIMGTSRDVYIRFWDIKTGKEVSKRKLFMNDSDTAEFIEERRTIVAGEFNEGRLYIWKFA